MICLRTSSLTAVLLLSILPLASCFFIQGASLTWNPPRTYASPRRTQSLTQESSLVYQLLSKATVLDPETGQPCKALQESDSRRLRLPFRSSKSGKTLVVILPQLGDLDSCEYAEALTNILPDLERANINLRVIGIGNCKSAHMLSLYTGLPLENLYVDPSADLHASLQLHKGPDWDLPEWIPEPLLVWFVQNVFGSSSQKDPMLVARAWLNYMAMCLGVASPGTLAEILRGYLGDKSAPERLGATEKIRAGPITFQGVSSVKVGPLEFQHDWSEEQGYLRPLELATARLRNFVEVSTKFSDYVPDQRYLDWRGGTFLLDGNSKKTLYEWRDKGVLTYSESMDRPLAFLSNYIGLERARNPFSLNDPEFVYEDA